MSRRGITPLSLVRAFGVFASTPFVGKRLPPRLSGTRRKKFSLTVFTTTAWKRVVNRKRMNPKNYLFVESLASYINRIDDILDQLNRPSPTRERVKYKSDPVARKHISDFVRGVRNAPLTPDQRRAIFKLAIQMRTQAWAELARFEKNPTHDLDSVLVFKERTTGGMGRIVVEMMNVAERIPESERHVIGQAFADAFMATQVPDDIVDIHEDRANRVANIADAILRKHPEENQRVINRPRVSIPWFQRNCPQSYAELQSLFEVYISRVPTKTPGQRTLKSIPALFMKLAQLTRR